MLRTAAMRTTALACSMALLTGCGGRGDAPDAGNGPVMLSDLTPVPQAVAGGTLVTMLLPADAGVDGAIWAEASRRVAAESKVAFAVKVAPEGGDPADLVAEAVDQGASVLIVVPGDPARLASALDAARGRGVEALTILEPVEGADGPIPAVVRPDLGPSAEALVDAAVADASKLGRSAEGPALILYDPAFDGAEARADALAEASKASGVALAGGAPAASSAVDAAGAIQEALASAPGLSMVFWSDDATFEGVSAAWPDPDSEATWALAGYMVDPTRFEQVLGSAASAAAFVDTRVLGIAAARAALALARGEAIDDRVEVPLPVERGLGPLASKTMVGDQPTARTSELDLPVGSVDPIGAESPD